MHKFRLIFCCIGLVVFPIGCQAGAEETSVTEKRPLLKVRLTTPKKDYVLGESVPLRVTVKNTSNKTLKTWSVDLKWEIGINISRDGNTFKQFTRGTFTDAEVETPVEPLKPRAEKRYFFRVLYTFYRKQTPERRSRLAFDKPGEYFVQVRYPLFPKREMFESNTIRIRITQPKGADAKVWEVLNEPEFLYFLQSGLVPKQDQKFPLKTANLLHSVESSSYHPALRYTLQRYYHRLPNPRPGFGDVKHGKLFRSALGIEEELVAIVPLLRTRPLSYRKLDVQRVTYHFPNYTLLKEVLDEISRQTGVSLKLGPGIHETSRFRSVRKSVTLREFMQTLVDPGLTTWVHEDNGFRLISVKDAKK